MGHQSLGILSGLEFPESHHQDAIPEGISVSVPAVVGNSTDVAGNLSHGEGKVILEGSNLADKGNVQQSVEERVIHEGIGGGVQIWVLLVKRICKVSSDAQGQLLQAGDPRRWDATSIVVVLICKDFARSKVHVVVKLGHGTR